MGVLLRGCIYWRGGETKPEGTPICLFTLQVHAVARAEQRLELGVKTAVQASSVGERHPVTETINTISQRLL